jgi:hypothetical protein
MKHAIESNLSIYEIMQIVSISAFDKTSIRELFTEQPQFNQNVKVLQYKLFPNLY